MQIVDLAAHPGQQVAGFIHGMRLADQVAVELKHLVAADDDAGVTGGNVQRLGFGQLDGDGLGAGAASQAFVLDGVFVEIGGDARKGQAGAGEQGGAGGGSGGEDEGGHGELSGEGEGPLAPRPRYAIVIT